VRKALRLAYIGWPATAAAAAGAFKHDTKLEVLKLGWCKVGGGEGARALADLLMFNNSLVQVRHTNFELLLCVLKSISMCTHVLQYVRLD
jgi:hypothetical protein